MTITVEVNVSFSTRKRSLYKSYSNQNFGPHTHTHGQNFILIEFQKDNDKISEGFSHIFEEMLDNSAKNNSLKKTTVEISKNISCTGKGKRTKKFFITGWKIKADEKPLLQ